MLVVFSPIFVADTKIIVGHDFVAPLKYVHLDYVTEAILTLEVHFIRQRLVGSP